ncbi:AI-2E family transporter [Nocardiopsis sp. MG754419]|uniref:AI-2E family transporter n=1 Tax=Nocardiopsis sp. MG754419 TaxID=2259865 RepID=UPI001BADD85A|nr:AI-2E family transporter [Nocardiopsis sp. MG754419]MBR8742898.1 AI-2E family transporter [Nocardiopsis sp. MG754419]
MSVDAPGPEGERKPSPPGPEKEPAKEPAREPEQDPAHEPTPQDSGGGAGPIPVERPDGDASGGPNYFVMGFVGALGVLSAWLMVEALTGARAVFVYIMVALFLAIGLNPVIELLRRRLRLPRWAAILTVCMALLLFTAVFVWAIIPPLSEQVSSFVSGLPGAIDHLQNTTFFRELDQRYNLLDRLQGIVTSGDVGQQVFGGLVGVGQVVFNGLFAVFTVFILTLFFMASLPGIMDVAYRFVPRSRREGVREIGDEIVQRIGAFIAGQLVVAAFGGVVAFLFLWAIGSAYALTLALVIAVTALIPLVGTTIGAVIATLAVGVVDPWLGLLTLVFFLIYQQIESYVLAPRVMRHAVDVAPTVNITAALVGGALLGLVGALLAIPTAAALTLVLKKVVFPRLERR